MLLELLAYTKPLTELEESQRILTRRRSSQDDAIVLEARQRLCSRGFNELCRIECECEDGMLTLRGRLSSFYLKQLAQEALRPLRGMKVIVNSIEVDKAVCNSNHF